MVHICPSVEIHIFQKTSSQPQTNSTRESHLEVLKNQLPPRSVPKRSDSFWEVCLLHFVLFANQLLTCYENRLERQRFFWMIGSKAPKKE